MADFEIELQLSSLRLRVKGSRPDIPVIAHQLGQQFAGLIQPAANLAATEPNPKQAALISPPSPESNGSRTRREGRPRRPRISNGEASPGTIVQWAHDPDRWGTPRQSWKPAQKIAWLLYVAAQESGTSDLSASTICQTFNAHFRQAGQLRRNNMARDLGRMKQRTPALVGENTSNSPSTWFLTEEGQKEGVKLVAEARGTSTQPSLIPEGD